ncbi:MAG: transporter substrate-binding domain-containing protein [Deltaproteobacteria bacterium]|nr:transporter substrate-binding domain-containing protein [Deltaproteobacteria bacterium]
MKKTLMFNTILSMVLLVFITTASAGPVIERIVKNGKLVVGTSGAQPPLSATDKNGEIIGMDADIAQLIAHNMGVKIEFKTMPFADLLPALSTGSVDLVISGMTITPKRNMEVAFVGPYYISGKGILTKKKHLDALQGAAGLNQAQFRVTALKDSTSQRFVEKEAPKAKLIPATSYDQAIQWLFDDNVDVLIADAPFCALTAFRFPEKGLTAGQDRLTFEPLGIAVKEDALMINWLQNFMLALNGSGELKHLTQKWLQDGSWISQLPE